MTDINKVKYHNFRKSKILIIEDSQDHSEIIKLAIKECIPEVQTIIVSTALQAIMFLDEIVSSNGVLPKLVLLDLYLPRKEDGWLVLQKIKRQSSQLRVLPVIILSASNDPEDIRNAYDLGGSAYTIKPVDYSSWLEYFKSIRKHWMETVILPFKSE